MIVLPEPTLTHRAEGGRDEPVLVWRLPEPVLAISSAVLGGGIGPCGWVVNASVPMSYDRDDPADHLTGIAAGLGLSGPGVGLLTGVDVAQVVTTEDGGVRLWATVGLGVPIRAAAPTVEAVPHVGTINVVAWVPVRLSAGALVNAVATITEAKAQAIRDLGWDATGTPTDAVCVLCPTETPGEAFTETRGEAFTETRGEEFTETRGEEFTETRGEAFTETRGGAFTETRGGAFTETPGGAFTGTRGGAFGVRRGRAPGRDEAFGGGQGDAFGAGHAEASGAGAVAAYGGPRSTWGARLARAAYQAVLSGK